MGRPLSDYVAPRDIEAFRSRLQALALGHKDGDHCEIHLNTRRQEGMKVHWFIRTDLDPSGEIHPDDWEKLFHAFRVAVRNWSVFEVDYRYKHDQGHWIDIEMRGKPIKGQDGETQVILVSRDVTRRKRMEEELRQTTLKLKTLITSLPFGIKVEDENGTPILFNDTYGRMLGRDRQIPAATDERLLEIVDKRLTLQGEELCLTDGTVLERDAVPLLDRGRFEGYLWIYRDITEKKRVEQDLREANQLLRNLSMLDGLTGVANRRCFDEAIEKEWGRQPEGPGAVSLLLFDIDHFKAFNDLYGHQAGDACLKLIGYVLKNLPWGSRDVVARYGGEEFVALLPGKSVEEALEVAASISRAVAELRIPHSGSSAGEFLSLSIGISGKPAFRFIPPSVLIAEADHALYEAKKSGRNQIRIYKRGRQEDGRTGIMS